MATQPLFAVFVQSRRIEERRQKLTATWRQRALQAPPKPPNDKSKKAPISQGLFVLLRGGAMRAVYRDILGI